LKNNCQICGKEYECCPDCHKRGNWRSIVCSPEHYQIVQILRDYREGVLTAQEATEHFALIGITADSELRLLDAVSRDIKKIIATGTPKRVLQKSKSEDTDKR
jgi:hypothetical protein